jgi:hypothetical protein
LLKPCRKRKDFPWPRLKLSQRLLKPAVVIVCQFRRQLWSSTVRSACRARKISRAALIAARRK